MPHHIYQSAAETRALKVQLPEEHREKIAQAVAIVDQIMSTPTTHRIGHVGCALVPRDGRAAVSGRMRAGKTLLRRATIAEAYDITASFYVMQHHIDGRGMVLLHLAALLRKLAKDLSSSASKLERADRKAVWQ